MDLEAKQIAKEVEEDNLHVINFSPHEESFTLVKHKGSPIIDKYLNKLYNEVADAKAEEYWKEKGRYKED